MKINSALILIDFINEIIDEKGKLASKGYAAYVRKHNIIDNVNNTLIKARKTDILIVFVTLSFLPDYSNWPESSPLFQAAKKNKALLSDSWTTKIHSSILLSKDDTIITKHRVSAFYQTNLDSFLRANNVQKVILGGVSTDLAVQSTARDAHDRDYQVIILEDLCAANNEVDHMQALHLLKKIAQIEKSYSLLFQ